MPLSICPSEAGDGRDNPTRLVRRVKVGARGDALPVGLRAALRLRALWITRPTNPRMGRSIFIEQGDGKLILRLRSFDVPLHRRKGDAYAEFTLRAGQKATFVLEEVRDRMRSRPSRTTARAVDASSRRR